MKLYPDSKVYICCPGNIQTGGPELCHQLASQLISFGVSVFMVYGANSTIPFNPDDPVHDAYKKYHVPYATSVEDDSKNIAILPEAFILQGAKKIRRVIWWMSVNNYIKKIWIMSCFAILGLTHFLLPPSLVCPKFEGNRIECIL